MTREVVLLAADMLAELGLRRMDEHAVSGAPVVDHGRVMGVVTRRDLLVATFREDSSGSLTLMPGKHLSRLDVCGSDSMSDEPVCRARLARWCRQRGR